MKGEMGAFNWGGIKEVYTGGGGEEGSITPRILEKS